MRNITIAIGIAAFALACNRTEELPPDSGPRVDANVIADSGPPDAGSDSGPELDAGPSDAGSDAGPSDGGTECTDPTGCWLCAPDTQDRLLNHCTTALCQGFDNRARLPLFTGPELPPLP
jgi:hypothetical protein